MANITNNWNKDMPSGTSLVSEGDDLMRQHQESLENTIEEEHYFTDSVTSAGIHKKGSGKAFCADLSALSTSGADDVGRLFYAVDNESLHILGESGTTKVAGSQQGGDVRSVLSSTYGWYISSVTSTIFQDVHQYKWVNSSGNPMTFRDGSERLLGLSVMSQGPSTVTYPHIWQAWSITSRGCKVIVSRGDQVIGAGVAPKWAAIGGANTGILSISAMGLISLSEMS